MMVWNMIKAENYSKQSLNEVVVCYIKDKILSGELQSGDKLIEMDISNALQISRAPLREALRVLNALGIVTFSPRRGNQVLSLTQAEVKEIFEIRTSIGLQVLNILVTKKLLSGKDYEYLTLLTKEMKKGENVKLGRRERIYLLNSLDIAFHRYLWRQSGSTRRALYLESLFFQLLIAMNKNTICLGTFCEKAAEHARIIAALESNNLERVHAEFSNHLREYMVATLKNSDIENI